MRHIGGYLVGLFYYCKGVFFFLTHPVLLKYTLLPWIILAVLFSSVLGPYFLLYPQYFDDFKRLLGEHASAEIVVKLILASVILPVMALLLVIPVAGPRLFEYAMTFVFGKDIKVFVNLILGIFALLVFLLVQGIVNKFFYKKLSRKVEEIVLGKVVPPGNKGFFREVWEGIKDLLHALKTYIGLAFVLLVCSFIPGVREVASVLSVSYCTGVAYLDYLFKRRNLHHQSKKEMIRHNLGLVLGFGSMCFVLLFFPIVNIFFIPLNIVVGTLLALELTKTASAQSKKI